MGCVAPAVVHGGGALFRQCSIRAFATVLTTHNSIAMHVSRARSVLSHSLMAVILFLINIQCQNFRLCLFQLYIPDSKKYEETGAHPEAKGTGGRMTAILLVLSPPAPLGNICSMADEILVSSSSVAKRMDFRHWLGDGFKRTIEFWNLDETEPEDQTGATFKLNIVDLRTGAVLLSLTTGAGIEQTGINKIEITITLAQQLKLKGNIYKYSLQRTFAGGEPLTKIYGQFIFDADTE